MRGTICLCLRCPIEYPLTKPTAGSTCRLGGEDSRRNSAGPDSGYRRPATTAFRRPDPMPHRPAGGQVTPPDPGSAGRKCDILLTLRRATPSTPSPAPFFLRPRRDGPECTIEDRIIQHLPELFRTEDPACIAGSVPLGAGMPDLIIATYRTLVAGLAEAGPMEANILAYLRVVRRARLETIAARLRIPRKTAERYIKALQDVQAITATPGAITLTPSCREVLPMVIAIEVKVDNWQRALGQASRNLTFAHRSFIALPVAVATRVRRVPEVVGSGVGVIGVEADGSVTVLKQSVSNKPRVWAYYYKLATVVGQRVARNQ